MKNFNHICSDFNNKFSQLNTVNTELKAKYSAKIKSLKSSIKTLKRELTLAQKASSTNKVKILFLKTKVVELEGKLKDLKLDPMFYDSNVVGGVIKKLTQINYSNPKRLILSDLNWNR